MTKPRFGPWWALRSRYIRVGAQWHWRDGGLGEEGVP